MIDAVLSSPLFGLTLTAGAWYLGLRLQQRTRLVICNPLLTAALIIIGVLTLFGVSPEQYSIGGDLIQTMLGPVTAVLALNIYHQRTVLGRCFVPVLAGCLTGSLTSLASVLVLCRAFGVDEILTASLLPKSVTTAIAIGISESRGGIQGIAAAAVVLAGIEGALLAPLFARVFRVTDPVAHGVAVGACSHALGTTRAMEEGELQGAMSSVSLCVCGIMTSVLALFVP